VQSASGAIRYSSEPVGALDGGIELIGHSEEAAEGVDVAFGDALAVARMMRRTKAAQPGLLHRFSGLGVVVLAAGWGRCRLGG
jgi:hypothetical protein